MTRNRLLLCGLALALALAGCKKSRPSAEEDEGPSKQDIRQGIGRQAPAFARYNAATVAVAAQEGAPVFDLAAALPKSADYFYDDVHFNVRGADTAAALLARFMVERGVIPGKAR